jgi:rubrerythrin
MCAVDVIPAIQLPDFLCDDFENLDKLVMAGEVFLAAGKAERLEELCDLLRFPNMLKEEVMNTASSAGETVEAASSGEVQVDQVVAEGQVEEVRVEVEGAPPQVDKPLEEEQVWACVRCPRTYQTRRQVYDHWRTSHKDPGSCPTCGKSFTSQKLLQKHVKHLHGVSADYNCRRCGLGFTGMAKFTRHERVCGVPGLDLRSSRLLSPGECALCERQFSRPGPLRRHVIAAHKVLLRSGGPSFLQRVRARRAKRALAKQALACNVCNAAFTHLADFQRHTRKEHKVRSRGATVQDVGARGEEAPDDVHACQYCVALCHTGKELRKHLLSEHKGEKVWTCADCPKAFKSPASLKAHRYRHHGSGARLFTCSPGSGHGGCGKDFRLHDSLKKHLKVCGQVTGKPFNQLSGVQRRRRVDARLDRFRQELEGLDGEERHLFLLRLARDPDILDTINPFTIEDVLSVSEHLDKFPTVTFSFTASPGQSALRPSAADDAPEAEEALAGRHPRQHSRGAAGQEATP